MANIRPAETRLLIVRGTPTTLARSDALGQDDGDELLRLLILAVLAKAERPLDAEELAERVAAMLAVPPLLRECAY